MDFKNKSKKRKQEIKDSLSILTGLQQTKAKKSKKITIFAENILQAQESTENSFSPSSYTTISNVPKFANARPKSTQIQRSNKFKSNILYTQPIVRNSLGQFNKIEPEAAVKKPLMMSLFDQIMPPPPIAIANSQIDRKPLLQKTGSIIQTPWISRDSTTTSSLAAPTPTSKYSIKELVDMMSGETEKDPEIFLSGNNTSYNNIALSPSLISGIPKAVKLEEAKEQELETTATPYEFANLSSDLQPVFFNF